MSVQLLKLLRAASTLLELLLANLLGRGLRQTFFPTLKKASVSNNSRARSMSMSVKYKSMYSQLELRNCDCYLRYVILITTKSASISSSSVNVAPSLAVVYPPNAHDCFC